MRHFINVVMRPFHEAIDEALNNDHNEAINEVLDEALHNFTERGSTKEAQ